MYKRNDPDIYNNVNDGNNKVNDGYNVDFNYQNKQLNQFIT